MEISKEGGGGSSGGDKVKSNISGGREVLIIPNLEIHPPNITFADMY